MCVWRSSRLTAIRRGRGSRSSRCQCRIAWGCRTPRICPEGFAPSSSRGLPVGDRVSGEPSVCLGARSVLVAPPADRLQLFDQPQSPVMAQHVAQTLVQAFKQYIPAQYNQYNRPRLSGRLHRARRHRHCGHGRVPRMHVASFWPEWSASHRQRTPSSIRRWVAICRRTN